MHHKKFKNHLHHDKIVAALRDVEHKSTGRVQVFISANHVDDPVAAATKEFERMGLTRLPQRNGVLIFVAPRARKFAVIGDEAVHAKCGDDFWKRLADAMGGYFKKAEFSEGLLHGIQKAGELLAEHFPKPTGSAPGIEG